MGINITEEKIDELLLRLTKDKEASEGARELAKDLLAVSPLKKKSGDE